MARTLPAIPAGLPLLYVPRVVVARLTELVVRCERRPGGDWSHAGRRAAAEALAKRLGMPGRRAAVSLAMGQPPPAALVYAEECGVYRTFTGAGQGGYWIACPRCGRRAILLQAVDVDGRWRWRCRANEGCVQASGDRRRGRSWRRAEAQLAAYAFCWRIGLRSGMALRRQHHRVLELVRGRAPVARRPRDLLVLGWAAALLSVPMWKPIALRWRWPSGTPARPAAGPIRDRLSTVAIGAHVDACLHPDAFLQRYADGSGLMPA